jgi:hypothetical protein
MIVLLWTLSVFNLFAGLGGLAAALRLAKPPERARWRSKTLLHIADAAAWVLPLAAVAGTALAWIDVEAGRDAGALLALIPIGWLLLMGLLFAIVDFAEDGILGNARG